jgi:hypothetical protein
MQAMRSQSRQDTTAMLQAYRQYKAAQHTTTSNIHAVPLPDDVFRRDTVTHTTATNTSNSSSVSVYTKHNSMRCTSQVAPVMLKKPFNTALNIQSDLMASAKMATKAPVQENSEKDLQSAHTPPALPHHTPYATVAANTSVLLAHDPEAVPELDEVHCMKAENLASLITAADGDTQLLHDLRFTHSIGVGEVEVELVRRYLEVASTGSIDKHSALQAISDVTDVPLHQLQFIARDIEENGYGCAYYRDTDYRDNTVQYTDSNNVYACDWRDEHVSTSLKIVASDTINLYFLLLIL